MGVIRQRQLMRVRRDAHAVIVPRYLDVVRVRRNVHRKPRHVDGELHLVGVLEFVRMCWDRVVMAAAFTAVLVACSACHQRHAAAVSATRFIRRQCSSPRRPADADVFGFVADYAARVSLVADAAIAVLVSPCQALTAGKVMRMAVDGVCVLEACMLMRRDVVRVPYCVFVFSCIICCQSRCVCRCRIACAINVCEIPDGYCCAAAVRG